MKVMKGRVDRQHAQPSGSVGAMSLSPLLPTVEWKSAKPIVSIIKTYVPTATLTSKYLNTKFKFFSNVSHRTAIRIRLNINNRRQVVELPWLMITLADCTYMS